MSLLGGRTRLLARFGQTVTITRGATTATGLGVVTRYQADALVGVLVQGDVRIEVLASDFTTIDGGPRNPDAVGADGVCYTVQYANPVHEGATLIGWSLTARGG